MADVKQIIKDLQGNFSGSNEDQMKAVQLLKGLATSDEAISNEFMKKLDQATTSISKEVLKQKETNQSDRNYLNSKQTSKLFIENLIESILRWYSISIKEFGGRVIYQEGYRGDLEEAKRIALDNITNIKKEVIEITYIDENSGKTYLAVRKFPGKDWQTT